jgi:chromosomal replication initiation ATPase DnaA
MDQQTEDTDFLPQRQPSIPPDEAFFRQAVHSVEQRLALAVLNEVQPPDLLPRIIEHVARAFRVPVLTLKSKSRRQHVAFCRQVAMFVCRRVSGVSFPKVGEAFNRDHSTVIHAFNLVGSRVGRDPGFRSFVEKLEAHITAAAELNTEAAA